MIVPDLYVLKGLSVPGGMNVIKANSVLIFHFASLHPSRFLHVTSYTDAVAMKILLQEGCDIRTTGNSQQCQY